MIRRLQIEGWRAFDRLTLELDPGCTFVVAENGVGKTSLIEAASWGLYGGLSGIDARAASRFGEGRVRVQADIELPDGRILALDRAVSGGGETLRAYAGREELDDAGVADVMQAAFGASREFLSRTTLLSSATVTDHSAGIFQLHRHLCHVFGVDDLQAAAAALRRAQASAEADAKKYRQQTRHAAEDMGRLRAGLVVAEEAVRAAEQARARARDAVTIAQAALDRARAAEAARAQAEADLGLLQEIQASAASLLTGDAPARTLGTVGLAPGLADLRCRLTDAEAGAMRTADAQRGELALVAAQLAAARTALTELHGAGAECPVCHRGLAPEDVVAADQAHQRNIATLSERHAALQSRAVAADQQIKDLRSLIARAAQLRPATASPTDKTAIGLDAAIAALDRARAAEDERADQAADARAERNALQRRESASPTVRTGVKPPPASQPRSWPILPASSSLSASTRSLRRSLIAGNGSSSTGASSVCITTGGSCACTARTRSDSITSPAARRSSPCSLLVCLSSAHPPAPRSCGSTSPSSTSTRATAGSPHRSCRPQASTSGSC
jgi:hypothetical protein